MPVVIGPHALTLELASPKDLMIAGNPAVKVSLNVSGNAGQLGLPPTLVRLALDGLDPMAPVDHPDGDLLLEAALAAPLEALEGLLGRTIALAQAGAPLPPDLVALGIRVRRGGISLGLAVLRLCAADAMLIADGLGPPQQQSALSAHLRVGISIEAGSLMLSPAALKHLGHGDILLADETPGASRVRLVIAGQKTLIARKTDSGLELITPLDGASQEPTTMDQAPPPSSETSAEALPQADSLNGLMLQVVFEIGRLEMPLGQLQAMRPGYVLDLNRPAALSVDLVVRGQAIGKAELVQVDNTLGARIVRLFEHD